MDYGSGTENEGFDDDFNDDFDEDDAKVDGNNLSNASGNHGSPKASSRGGGQNPSTHESGIRFSCGVSDDAASVICGMLA